MSLSLRIKTEGRRLYEKGGVLRAAIAVLRFAKNVVLQRWYSLRPGTFSFQGISHRYFYHRYNRTWLNERTVEVPLARAFLARAGERRVLEVGNVLACYVSISHDVLDKYEKGDGVMNEDVVDFRPRHPYERIISVSTMEHVGWDEAVKDPGKILRGLQNLIAHALVPGGKLFVTMPLGYNPNVDRSVETGVFPFQERYFLKRVSPRGWREATYEEVRGSKYGSPFDAANAVFVGIFTKPATPEKL